MIITGNVGLGGSLTDRAVPVPTRPTPRAGADIVTRLEAARAKRETRAYPILPPQPKVPREYVHGTVGGYQGHVRRGEKPCDDCRQARSDYVRERRGERKPRKLKPIVHGTTAGYQAEKRRFGKACPECLSAKNEYARSRERAS